MRDEGRAVFVGNTLLDPSVAAAESLLGGPAQTAMAVPVWHHDRILGALYASSRRGSLTLAHVELLEVYATLAVGLLETARATITLQAQLTDLGGAQPDSEGLLVGSSEVMQQLRRSLRKVAVSKAPVLIRGETGTGKDLVAREIHRLSPRARGPFIAVNCGAIPPELVASELFGHVKGAFTQAHRDRLGFFRSADTGTLFLDEIGEMPLAQQVALLRALQDGCVMPVGSEVQVPVDVRLLCATNRELDADVASGRFRQDLYYRIMVLTVAVAPLRDRPGDAVVLAQHFLGKYAREQRIAEPRFTDDAIRALKHAPWEGNVRALEAAVRRAVVMCESNAICAHDLGLDEPWATPSQPDAIRPLAMARDEYLRDYVRKVVDRLGGNRTAAAEALIVTPRTVFKYLEE
jgi:DNA-binding NtrC family response regulator